MNDLQLSLNICFGIMIGALIWSQWQYTVLIKKSIEHSREVVDMCHEIINKKTGEDK